MVLPRILGGIRHLLDHAANGISNLKVYISSIYKGVFNIDPVFCRIWIHIPRSHGLNVFIQTGSKYMHSISSISNSAMVVCIELYNVLTNTRKYVMRQWCSVFMLQL